MLLVCKGVHNSLLASFELILILIVVFILLQKILACIMVISYLYQPFNHWFLNELCWLSYYMVQLIWSAVYSVFGMIVTHCNRMFTFIVLFCSSMVKSYYCFWTSRCHWIQLSMTCCSFHLLCSYCVLFSSDLVFDVHILPFTTDHFHLLLTSLFSGLQLLADIDTHLNWNYP